MSDACEQCGAFPFFGTAAPEVCPFCAGEHDSEENVCEHGDHPAPDGKRFCSLLCERCEHESQSENGCDAICERDGEEGE